MDAITYVPMSRVHILAPVMMDMSYKLMNEAVQVKYCLYLRCFRLALQVPCVFVCVLCNNVHVCICLHIIKYDST